VPLAKLWRLSRPRFWIYVFGPYLVGISASNAQSAFTQPLTLLFGLYFLLPANLLIYGVNDIFDYATDILNPKKTGYEDLVPPTERKSLGIAIAVTNLPFVAALFFLPIQALLSLAAFLFLSLFYSAPPIRAKARPIIDALFNALYIFPGYVSYFLAGGRDPKPALFLAAWCWAIAMHAYSAVPDISADRQSQTPTVATKLGLRGTLFFCLALYLNAALLSLATLTYLSVVLAIVYATLIILSLRAGTESGVLKIYRVFPWINTLAGMALFFRVIFL
jgi:lycopene elongase/hydratase (dihydrobisanhydrobacterioruberin-forming)